MGCGETIPVRGAFMAVQSTGHVVQYPSKKPKYKVWAVFKEQWDAAPF